MAKQYIVKESYRDCVVATRKPEYRKNGLFKLSECTQRDLKFLYKVIHHPAIQEIEHVEKE